MVSEIHYLLSESISSYSFTEEPFHNKLKFFLKWYFLLLKFIYSEKATKFWEIFTLLLSYVMPVKSKVKISQNFVAFSEYMNFIILYRFIKKKKKKKSRAVFCFFSSNYKQTQNCSFGTKHWGMIK